MTATAEETLISRAYTALEEAQKPLDTLFVAIQEVRNELMDSDLDAATFDELDCRLSDHQEGINTAIAALAAERDRLWEREQQIKTETGFHDYELA